VDGSMNGFVGADDACNKLAQDANLAGTYSAWLSADRVSAAARVGAGPYVNVRNEAIASSKNALVTNGPSRALSRTQWGEAIRTNVWTGTTPTGTVASNTCSTWSATTARGNFGDSSATGSTWTFDGGEGAACTNRAALYCFQGSATSCAGGCNAPLSCISGECGLHAFVTRATSIGNFQGEVRNADAVCMESAKEGLLDGTWRAWLTSERDGSAANRVENAPYYRLDGVRIARNRAALIDTEATPLEAPLNVDETGTLTNNRQVWTGTDPKGERTSNCNEWSTTDASGMVGDPNATNATWTNLRALGCSSPAALYCFRVRDPL
jgi:hypothetical protein